MLALRVAEAPLRLPNRSDQMQAESSRTGSSRMGWGAAGVFGAARKLPEKDIQWPCVWERERASQEPGAANLRAR